MSQNQKKQKNQKNKNTKKKTRLSTVAKCIRSRSATARLARKDMPDSTHYDASAFTAEMSAKFAKLVDTIRKLDTEDKNKHGTLFKHFIFTDIRESAYGAKAIASFLMANGFDLRMKLQGKFIKRDGKFIETKTGETILHRTDPVKGGSNGFAVLQSLPLWKNPLSVKTKKDILQVFNSRPDNIHGEHIRIIILDSKFKEGIDLFDVKYAHIMEPPISNADIKQAVGRATRFCGQKGLAFIPNLGWQLQVYLYKVILPKREPFEIEDAHDLMMAKSGLDLALLNIVKELTVLAIRSSVDYDLNFKINNFSTESALLDMDAIVSEVIPQGGAQRNPILIDIHTMDNITPELLQRCLKRKSKLFPFSRARMERDAKRMGMKIPKQAKRAWYCEQLKTVPQYLEKLLAPEEVVSSPNALPVDSISTLSNENSISPITSPIGSLRDTTKGRQTDSAFNDALVKVRTLFPSPIDSEYVPSIHDWFESKESLAKLNALLQSLPTKSFQEFQQAIMNIYGKYKWGAPIIQNGCMAIEAGKVGKPVTFTKTQDFVRHYLIPESPFKGLLAWHSVGTGKTCMAVAAATSQFEKAGYSILWVTRNSLVADVYKNIFGSVCSIPIMEEIQKGKEIPSDIVMQKRMLSKGWFPPISYRTFQNALQGKNELGRLLRSKNKDPLFKTFLVMDEVHKLQDGDLGAAESADFRIIQQYIHESYLHSGKNSVRPLLMTATPITDSPNELFDILNTIIEKSEHRLMPFRDFRSRFTNTTGAITEQGTHYFQERVKGLISYLNREYDPTTFTQPIFYTIQVPLADQPIPSAKEIAKHCYSETRKNSKVCYNQEKKKYIEQTKKSQIHGIDQCFEPISNTHFPTFREMTAV